MGLLDHGQTSSSGREVGLGDVYLTLDYASRASSFGLGRAVDGLDRRELYVFTQGLEALEVFDPRYDNVKRHVSRPPSEVRTSAPWLSLGGSTPP